jgi:hypothetical protein
MGSLQAVRRLFETLAEIMKSPEYGQWATDGDQGEPNSFSVDAICYDQAHSFASPDVLRISCL